MCIFILNIFIYYYLWLIENSFMNMRNVYALTDNINQCVLMSYEVY